MEKKSAKEELKGDGKYNNLLPRPSGSHIKLTAGLATINMVGAPKAKQAPRGSVMYQTGTNLAFNSSKVINNSKVGGAGGGGTRTTVQTNNKIGN